MNASWGVFFTALLILYMGLRPVNAVFGDTMNYAMGFYAAAENQEPFTWDFNNNEWLFHNMMNWFAKFSNIHSFFLLCAAIYIGCLWLATIRIFKNYYYIPLLIIISMFTFWQYGVNGIRNGMGASLFILAITYVNNLPIMITLALSGYFIHNSVILMTLSAAVAWFVKNSKLHISIWFASIFISYFVGETIQNYLSNISLFSFDEKFSGYLTGENMIGEIVQMSMTFRWDFILYSAVGTAVGYYFIILKNFKDEYYHWIFNTYLLTNTFWIFIIRAAYSNRFAQISWFLLPIVLIYPFFKQRFWKNHEKMLGYAIVIFYLFTFYFNILK